jgi:hypothetical protein
MSINLPVFGDDIFDGWVVSLFPSVVVVVRTTGAVSEKNQTIKSNTNHTTPSEKFKYLIENRRNRGTIDHDNEGLCISVRSINVTSHDNEGLCMSVRSINVTSHGNEGLSTLHCHGLLHWYS